MARNGSGGYSLLVNTWNPATTGVSATVTDWQALINDIATAMQQSVSSDGQTAMTGNLAMGNNKLTGLSAGTATGHSLRWEQLFSQGTIANLASATTTDIGAQNTSFLNITGTTAITGFGSNFNGPRYLVFAGILTLTHSATLVCPGAANITTAANDAAIAIPITGGWQIVAYQKASGLPVSTTGLAPLSSPTFTGTPAAPTASAGTNTTQVATTAFVLANNVPAGTIIDFAGTAAPTGFLACPTTATNISRATYATLFAAIGTTWGAGDGSTTFGCPWFPENYAAVQANANVGTATVGENLAHTHTASDGGGFQTTTGGPAYGSSVGGSNSAATTSSNGGTANLAAGHRVLKCVKL